VIPPELWRLAARLAAAYGVSPVARALRLDYYGLKGRLESAKAARASGSAPRAFVEIVPAPSEASPECRVEFEDARGTRMRITWTARGAPDLEALGRLFLAGRG
jgi:hypothetical protein